MSFVQYDHMIECVSAYTADDPLAIGILPRRRVAQSSLLQGPLLSRWLERRTVDRIPVPQQITRRGIPRECLNDLLGRPLGGWMFGDVDMHDTATLVSQHDKHE